MAVPCSPNPRRLRFMADGEIDPLGACSLYLGETVDRIHKTNQPSDDRHLRLLGMHPAED
jgi:hypothetical protein